MSIGGVNGHAVLEPYLPNQENSISTVVSRPMIMLISGRSKSVMQAVVESNIEQLETPSSRI